MMADQAGQIYLRSVQGEGSLKSRKINLLKISNLKLRIDFPTKKELVASKHDINWIRDFIGADSLEYLSLEGMLNSMPLPKEDFCTACYTGEYPSGQGCRCPKNILEQ